MWGGWASLLCDAQQTHKLTVILQKQTTPKIDSILKMNTWHICLLDFRCYTVYYCVQLTSFLLRIFKNVLTFLLDLLFFCHLSYNLKWKILNENLHVWWSICSLFLRYTVHHYRNKDKGQIYWLCHCRGCCDRQIVDARVQGGEGVEMEFIMWLQFLTLHFKGTQEWEFFWLRFWILSYFIVSYA